MARILDQKVKLFETDKKIVFKMFLSENADKMAKYLLCKAKKQEHKKVQQCIQAPMSVYINCLKKKM